MNNYSLEKDFLPVGSVVSVRFSQCKFMIMGFCPIDGNTNEMYDYSAVAYPVGFERFDNVVMFNRELVKNVFYLGYETTEEKEFKKSLLSALENNNKKGDGVI